MNHVLLLVAAALAQASPEAEVERALRLLAQDPPVTEVQRAALEHFRVTHDDLSSYRSAARLRALMPTVSGSYARNDGDRLRLETDRAVFGGGAAFDPRNPQVTDSASDVGRAYSAGVTWNLQSLVFDNSQLETYALVGIHEEVVKEVTRLYYTRQHNLLALALAPPSDIRARAGLILRTRELEAMLDAMTGGGWSKLKTAGAR